MLFSMFPKLAVNTLAPNTTTIVTDIFRRISTNKYRNNIVFLQDVTIPDGFTIEQVADKFYDRPDYHWVIMIINDIVDVRKEWPLSNSDLFAYAKKKYGETQIYETHHYRTTSEPKLVVDFDAGALAAGEIEGISNLAYEEELNDSKREIKILSSKYLTEFVSLYTSMISGN